MSAMMTGVNTNQSVIGFDESTACAQLTGECRLPMRKFG
jgi:hypothetical protein